MMRLHRLIGAAGLALAMAGCNGDQFTDTPVVPTATIRFINAVPDTGSVDYRMVDIVENSSFFSQPFRSTGTAATSSFNTLVYYQPAKAGQRHLKVFFTSATQSIASTVIVDTTVTLTEGKYYTFVLYGYMRAGSAPAKKLMVMEDTPTDPGTQVGLRVMNLGLGLGAGGRLSGHLQYRDRRRRPRGPRRLPGRHASRHGDATLRVGRNIVSYWKKAADTQRLLRYYEKFTVPVQDMLADISQHGCLIDQKRLAENTKLGMEKAGELHKKLISRLPEQIKKDFAKTGKGLMLTRKNLVRAMVFGHLKCIPDRRFITKVTKEPECTVDHLTLFKAKHPWIESYLDWGALNKIVTSYLLNMPQHIKNDGRVNPSTLLTTTVTGRSSIVAPAIQTIPQRSSYAYLSRSMFIPDAGMGYGRT